MGEPILRVRRESTAEGIRLTGLLTGVGAGSEVWWLVPHEHASAISPANDFALLGHFFHLMRHGGAVRIEGPVSPSLLANLEELNACWARWCPGDFRGLRLVAPDAQELSPPGAETACTFSGGLDACYTLWRHVGPGALLPADVPALWRKRAITGALLFHGLDIPLKDAAGFARARARAQRLVDGVKVELLTAATNYRSLLPCYWEYQYATVLAAGLHVFSGRFATGLIASSRDYAHLLMPHGSTPLGNPLMSSRRLRVVLDGSESTRIEKCRGLLTWPLALKHLRVCWEGAERDGNCGRCEKCIRTILNFRVAGGRNLPCFPDEISDKQIRALRMKPNRIPVMRNIISEAEQAGFADSSWLRALKLAVRDSNPIRGLPFWKRLRARLALRTRLGRLLGPVGGER